MLTKRELLCSAALGAITVTATRLAPVQAQTSTRRPGFFGAKDIAEAGYIYGLPIVMNYGCLPDDNRRPIPRAAAQASSVVR